MINKKAITDYLDTQLDNWNWVKSLTREELEKELKFCSFKTKPFKHQLECILIGLINDNFLFFSQQGTGKTKTILDILSNRKDWSRALIVSPNATTVSTWSDQIKEHSNFSYLELLGRIEDRWENIDQKSDIVLVNYTGLLLMLSNSIDKSWKLDVKKIKELGNKFDVLIVDELHFAKSNKSLTSKILNKLSKFIKIKYGLTGTPINRDPISFFPIFKIIDGGETLGDNITLFREAYFDAKQNYWGGIDYKFKKELKENLYERLCNKSIRHTKEEALDLPEKTIIQISIDLTPEQSKYYIGEFNTFANLKDIDALKLSFSKLRMLCSGYLKFENEEGESKIIEIKKNNKLDALVDIIKETDSKVVVFLEHIKSGELVSKRLTKEKIKHQRLYGGTKDKIGAKDTFLKDKDCQVLVANIKSGGTGLNLQIASYAIFYELPTSSIEYNQAMDRVHRAGSSNKVFIYELITKDTVEERIKKFLNEGKNIQKALVDGAFKKGK